MKFNFLAFRREPQLVQIRSYSTPHLDFDENIMKSKEFSKNIMYFIKSLIFLRKTNDSWYDSFLRNV